MMSTPWWLLRSILFGLVATIPLAVALFGGYGLATTVTENPFHLYLAGWLVSALFDEVIGDRIRSRARGGEQQ